MSEELAEPVALRPPARSAATIYDIAKLAGVNPSTVSRALSKPGRINIKTEERIQAAAKELNYRLNPMARALPTGRTSTLGLLLADITNPYIFNVVRGAESEAARHGYTLILAESQESGEREKEAAERIIQSVDALVLVATRLDDPQIADLAERKPLVVINRRVKGVTSVVPEIEPGIDQALALLADLGHTSLAYLSGPTSSWMSAARWNFLLAKAPKAGMSIVEIGPSSPTLQGGGGSLSRIVASRATAVLAYNDLMAIGLMRAAQEAELSVPGQLSILGFDDIFGSDFTSPQLTTIRTPLGIAGEYAVRLALGMLDEPAEPPEESADEGAEMATELVVRESVGRSTS